MLDSVRGAMTVLIPAAALIFAWWQWKVRELRREDVLEWGNDAIDCLHTIWLVLTFDDAPILGGKAAEMLRSEAIRASVLVEQGRLFFKNQIIDPFGAEKPAAYRGYRPLILDPLVLGHQIACYWMTADDRERDQLRALSLAATRTLVSLLQEEVGRGQTASAVTQKGGRGIVLETLLAAGTVMPWTAQELDRPTRAPLRLRLRAALRRTRPWRPIQ